MWYWACNEVKIAELRSTSFEHPPRRNKYQKYQCRRSTTSIDDGNLCIAVAEGVHIFSLFVEKYLSRPNIVFTTRTLSPKPAFWNYCLIFYQTWYESRFYKRQWLVLGQFYLHSYLGLELLSVLHQIFHTNIHFNNGNNNVH